MFRSIDLETYVNEVDPSKMNLLLINKADLLSPSQIEEWRIYFETNKINAIFWSALDASSLDEEMPESQGEEGSLKRLSLSESGNVSFVHRPEVYNYTRFKVTNLGSHFSA